MTIHQIMLVYTNLCRMNRNVNCPANQLLLNELRYMQIDLKKRLDYA